MNHGAIALFRCDCTVIARITILSNGESVKYQWKWKLLGGGCRGCAGGARITP